MSENEQTNEVVDERVDEEASTPESEVAEETTVSDAVEAARPEAVSEEDRKVAIKRNMGANYRDKVARRDALRNEGVKTLEVSVNPNRTEPEPDDGAE